MSKIENFEMEMKPFHCKRKIWVYLPEGYGADGRVYPVIYMQDGQNLFYKELTLYGDVWHIDTAMERIYRQYGFAAIVVGVENSKDRITEYAPWKSSMKIAGIESMGGRGAEYAQFFAEDLKNEIDRRYNTERGRCGTAVIGSSAGGMISCYIGIRYQEIYGTMGLFSTAVSFNKKAMEEFISQTPQVHKQYAMIYAGGKEDIADIFPAEEMVDNSIWLYKTFASRGISAELVLNSDLLHNEYAWSIYFNKFAQDFLLRYYKAGE